jgi:hypothetical protein
MYALNAEDPREIELAENFTFPETADLADKQNWVYLNPSVLGTGRISHIKPEGLEEEEAEKQLKKLMERDPSEPRLKLLALDTSRWALQSVGLGERLMAPGRNPKPTSAGVIGLRSLVWRGWTTVAWEGKFSSLYVGYAQKAKFEYFPAEPERILGEVAEREEVVIKD